MLKELLYHGLDTSCLTSAVSCSVILKRPGKKTACGIPNKRVVSEKPYIDSHLSISFLPYSVILYAASILQYLIYVTGIITIQDDPAINRENAIYSI